jgi:hypothetical protein
MKYCVIFLLLCSSCLPVYADAIDVSYKSFYSHVRKLQQEDTDKLQFAFGFINVNSNSLCNLTSAQIITDKKTIPLMITGERRFTVPSERALNLADAIVQIEFEEKANQCDMSVQLETKPDMLKQNYTQAELKEIESQYVAFFNEMGSFLSFLMPNVKGLIISFSDEKLSASVGEGEYIEQGVLVLDDAAIDNVKALALPAVPLRITALSTR